MVLVIFSDCGDNGMMLRQSLPPLSTAVPSIVGTRRAALLYEQPFSWSEKADALEWARLEQD